MPFARDLCTLINTKSCFVQRLCNDKKTTQGFIAILDTKHSHCMLLAFPKCKALPFYLVEPLYKKHHIKIFNCFVLENNLFKTFEKFYLKHYLKIQMGRKIRLQYRQHLVTNTKHLYWSIQKEPKIAQFSKNAC